MQETVKLTIRIPPALHERLKQRAQALNRSLNTVIIDILHTELTRQRYYPETPDKQAQKVIRESGLWQPIDEEPVKLTARLPVSIHEMLEQRAQAQSTSLNNQVVETLKAGFHKDAQQELSERERIIRLLQENRLLADGDRPWELLASAGYGIPEGTTFSQADLYEELKGIPPLSPIIIEERGPK
jgi:predicted HicB family RNase H-like nuclease